MQKHPIHQLPQPKSMTSTDLPALLPTNATSWEHLRQMQKAHDKILILMVTIKQPKNGTKQYPILEHTYAINRIFLH